MLQIHSINPSTVTALHFTMDRAALLRALSHVQSVVERRNTIPILGNVKIDAAEGQIRLTATDMDIAVVESVEAKVETEGTTTAPAHMLHDIVRKLPDGAEVAIFAEEDGSRLTITAGRASFSLPCLPVEDFPVMEEGSFTHNFTIASSECVELIERTRFAISTEETRYYLNGVFFHTVKEGDSELLRAVATDGHRLARMEVAKPSGSDEMPGIIIPRKTVGELKKILEESDKDVQIELSENKIRFSAGNVTLVSKLIDGTFPDYGRVIPSGNDRLLELDCKPLISAVDRVSTIASDKSRAVKFALEQGTLTLFADGQDNADAQEVLEVSFSAEPLEIGFNSRYLLEMLQQIEGDTVQFVFADTTAPALVRDPGNVGALYVIMPMRV